MGGCKFIPHQKEAGGYKVRKKSQREKSKNISDAPAWPMLTDRLSGGSAGEALRRQRGARGRATADDDGSIREKGKRGEAMTAMGRG
jgi:hypothetical protein